MEHYTYRDFIAYALIYIGNSDFVITEEEKAVIVNDAGKESFDKALADFKAHSDSLVIENIQNMALRYLTSQEKKDEFCIELKRILSKPDAGNQIEKPMEHLLERIIQ